MSKRCHRLIVTVRFQDGKFFGCTISHSMCHIYSVRVGHGCPDALATVMTKWQVTVTVTVTVTVRLFSHL
jgi:hypothetical protein